jgi:inner membrane protein
VIDDVSKGWGGSQTHTGPLLVIPYLDMTTVPKSESIKRNLIIMPESLVVDGNLMTQSKYRSLYKVLLYKTKLKVSGNFRIPSEEEINIKASDLLFKDSYIVLGISDLKGIDNKVNFTIAGRKIEMKPGLQQLGFSINEVIKTESDQMQMNVVDPNLNSGLNGNVEVNSSTANYPFNYEIDLRGSKNLFFVPMGKNTEVSLSSKFPNPIFTGEFLPEHNTNEDGFAAKWKILEYNKSIPEFQKDQNTVTIGKDVFGLEIKTLVDTYTKSNRAGKYMFLFTILTFLVVFLTEIIQKQKVHIFQYTLVGLALAIFFIMLLSVSEFLNFDLAYLIAGSATIILIFLYSMSLFTNKKSSYLLLGLLVTLFGYIYLIIQLENSALLFGSIGLFIIVAATMYVTRKVSWFEEE